MKGKRDYRVDVDVTLSGYVVVRADSEDEARSKATDNFDLSDFHEEINTVQTTDVRRVGG